MTLMKEFLFIGGCPRSGTSLLSSLIGNLEGVAIVQDFTALHQLKRAALRTICVLNQMPSSEHHQAILSGLPKIDLRTTEFFPEFLSLSPEVCLNDFKSPPGLILRFFIQYMDIFLFRDFNASDPRKDRGQGIKYLENISLNKLLKCETMLDLFVDLLVQASKPLSANVDVSLICEKTPENLSNIDVISMLTEPNGYRFLHLVRDPVSVFGARRQRVRCTIEEFVHFFKLYSEPAFKADNCNGFSTIRYEDLIESPAASLTKSIKELGLNNLLFVPEDIGNNVNPGKYKRYVGNSIDNDRDKANRAMVLESEKAQLYQALSEYCEKYSYGLFATAS